MSANQSPQAGPPQFPPEYVAADRSPGLRAFCIVMVIVTVLPVALRFWSRSMSMPRERFKHRFGLDDWFSLLAVPFILAQLALSILGVAKGFGRHMGVLATFGDPEDLMVIAKSTFAIYFLYNTALLLCRASALLFLRRVFPAIAVGKWFNNGVSITHGMNVAWWIGCICGTIFHCNPVEKNWDAAVEGECLPNSGMFIGSAVPSVFIDLVILLLPLPLLWHIKVSAAKKIGIIMIFILGYGVIVVSLGRLVTVLKSSEALDNDITCESGSPLDADRVRVGGIPVVYWVTAEPVILLLCTCLPASLHLGRHLMSAYVSPVMSAMYTSLTSLRGTGRSGAQVDGGCGNRIGSIRSVESREEFIKVSPHQEYHMADVKAVSLKSKSSQIGGTPNRIRVDNDVSVV
ncbi:hypothetical protein QBC37DRAFT_282345 [Rhypophila decipiens]|uniref:Rhodopsin domain-containing protein n=1 Tax=Rhypophila decipiens TaxID=261697 RepID=A0AAN6Y9H3_9PEZI|nr:hypothetical protein QBC37DRAFT_282345 [Rhypophila decipiens]